MKHINLIRLNRIDNHPYLRALADVTVGGFVIRGIKLEQARDGQLVVAFPGRKIQGRWQVICEAQDEAVKAHLLDLMQQEFEQVAA